MNPSQDDYIAPVKRSGLAALAVLAILAGGATATLAQEPVRADRAPWVLNDDGELLQSWNIALSPVYLGSRD
jgi:hypothetical protein